MDQLDEDISIVYHANNSLIPRENVRVNSSDKFNRQTIPDVTLNAKLEKTWQKRLESNSRLWNGTKFRIHSVLTDNSGDLTFNLGVTCYKDFLSTNWADYADDLRTLGLSHGDERMYLADAMGVGALVLTLDNKVILLRRSHHVAEAPGDWDVPGGHAEPEMLPLVGKKCVEEIHPDQMPEHQVVHEMFDSIIREIVDEVNIPVDRLSDPRIMGVAGNNLSAGRASVEFLVRCSLKSEEIIRRYHLGSQAEADESTNILMLDTEDILRLQKCAIWPKLAPSAKGCFHLYHLTHRLNGLTH